MINYINIETSKFRLPYNLFSIVKISGAENKTYYNILGASIVKTNNMKKLKTGIKTKLVGKEVIVYNLKEIEDMEEQNRINAINTFGLIVLSGILICIGSLLFASAMGWIKLYV